MGRVTPCAPCNVRPVVGIEAQPRHYTRRAQDWPPCQKLLTKVNNRNSVVPVKKTAFRVVLLLVVAFGIFGVYSVLSLFIDRHGTAGSVSDLQKVYNKAGSRIAATFTNSLIQKFPFDGPIDWKLIFFKDPMVFLYAKVDTNSLHQFISSHPDTRFLWSSVSGEVEEGWPSSKDYPGVKWTNIMFQTGHDSLYGAAIDGTIELLSRDVVITSH